MNENFCLSLGFLPPSFSAAIVDSGKYFHGAHAHFVFSEIQLYNPALEFCLQAKALKQKFFEKQIFTMVITNKYLYIISRQGFIRQAKNPLIYGISCIDEVKNEVSRRGSKF